MQRSIITPATASIKSPKPHDGKDARTTFATQVPTLSTEKAKGTKLFEAFEDLVVRVARWTARLAHDRGTNRSISSGDACANTILLETDARLPYSSHADTDTDIEFVPPVHSPEPKRHKSPSRRHTQTAGEDVGLNSDLFETRAHSPSRRTTTSMAAATVANLKVPVLSSSLTANATSTSSSSAYANNRTTPINITSGVVANESEKGRVANNNNKTSRTPTTTSTTSPPPWLMAEVEAFFHDRLAAAIQVRETELVNVMHDCVQQELQEKERRVVAERERIAALNTQVSENGKLLEHFQSKLDRRVAENNALRKDFYKQLLMLRELVSKHRSDPRTIKALDEVISSITGVKLEHGAEPSTAKDAPWSDKQKKDTKPDDLSASATAGAAGSTAMRREKEKWEQRAREAAAECQQLQEQLLLCKQQLEEARGLDGELWFASSQHGLYERQRIIDCVYKSKCTWEDVGDSIVELLNNESVWEAVEDSAYREKTRVSRGLEALLLRMESSKRLIDRSESAGTVVAGSDLADGDQQHSSGRRRPAFSQESRLIMCRTCNGCGYLDSSAAMKASQAGGVGAEPAEPEDDSYLRKTLAQVLELKASLEEATTRTSQVEQELVRTVMEGTQTKERLEKLEFVRAHGVDSSLQVDLDEEEEINMDEIMNAYNNIDEAAAGKSSMRKGNRTKQYENLIVELKNLLSERDSGLAQLKVSVTDAQNRLATVQRTSQQEQERLQRELEMAKESLALTLLNRNEAIEEKQAAVKMMLTNMDRKQSQIIAPRINSEVQDDVNENADDNNDDTSAGDDDDDEQDGDPQDEVQRAERIARRYSNAISRVQQEYDEQQHRLKQAEDELGSENDKRKRTSSISMGNIIVTMSSHPRDLFKALSSTHQDLLSLRRSSQHASTLQTDRLLTLTTHLAHISEELAMVKKRTCAEIDFWKLDCEKLQNANRDLAVDLQNAQKDLKDALERIAEDAGNRESVIDGCTICDKHEARLLQISTQLLVDRSATPVDDANPSRRACNRTPGGSGQALGSSSELNEIERNGLGAILLDLENLYSTLSSTKQQCAKEAITRALVGTRSNPSNTTAAFSAGSTQDREPSGATTGESAAPQSQRPNSAGKNSAQTANRLFADPVVYNVEGGRKDQEDAFLLHGLSIPTDRLPRENGAPSHYRKTIVRKILSEKEVAQRHKQQERTSRGRPTWDGGYPPEIDQGSTLRGDDNNGNDGIIPAAAVVEGEYEYASYIDEDGIEVFYVDVEVDDDKEDGPSAHHATSSFSPQEEAEVVEPHPNGSYTAHDWQQQHTPRRVDYTIQIPTPTPPNGGQIATTSAPSLSTRFLKNNDDPDVIATLRDLVKLNSTAREELALTNWQILVSHLRAAREKKRLDYVNQSFRDALTAGKIQPSTSLGMPSLPYAVRTTMQKLVQYRELALDAAVRHRDALRKASRRAQAQLIHGVSTVLTNLSRKNKVRMPTSDTLQFVHVDPETASPPRSPAHSSPQRPLYPSARVNLSQVPDTQQISTPSFPFSTSPSVPLQENQATWGGEPKSRPSSATTSPRSARSDRDKLYGEPPTSSIFESDNRFPQRLVKFVPAGEGEEQLSLTHATSSIRFPQTPSPSISPTKSPSKLGLSLDARRRPTHSASAVRSPRMVDVMSTESSRIGGDSAALVSAVPQFIDLAIRRPTRPQSSPAGNSRSIRSGHPPEATLPTGSASEIRAPQRAVSSGVQHPAG